MQVQPTPPENVGKQWFDYPAHHWMHHYLRGKLGLNVGLDNNLDGLNKYLYGMHRGRYYLVGADSGVGKTTFVDYGFVLNAWYAAKKANKRLHIFYYSFEISKVEKTSRWISFMVYKQFGKIIPSEYIMNRIEGVPLTEEDAKMVEAVFPLVEEIMRDIQFVEDPIHPTFIFQTLIDHHFDHIGKVERAEPTEEQRKQKRKGRIISYTPKPDHMDDMTLVVVDHVALTLSEKGMSTKETIDRLSSYFVQLRNLFGATIVVVQQFNSDLQTFNRNMQLRSRGASIILPQKLDFGDSKYTYRDADVVIGLVKPAQFDLDTFFDVDIKLFREYYISASLMKNRYGSDNHMFDYFVNPIVGSFEYIDDARSTNPFLTETYLPKIEELDECQKLFYPKRK